MYFKIIEFIKVDLETKNNFPWEIEVQKKVVGKTIVALDYTPLPFYSLWYKVWNIFFSEVKNG